MESSWICCWSVGVKLDEYMESRWMNTWTQAGRTLACHYHLMCMNVWATLKMPLCCHHEGDLWTNGRNLNQHECHPKCMQDPRSKHSTRAVRTHASQLSQPQCPERSARQLGQGPGLNKPGQPMIDRCGAACCQPVADRVSVMGHGIDRVCAEPAPTCQTKYP